jgi:hypothetical protein
MKTVGILMNLKIDNSGKKVEKLSPVGGNISLPENCVICNEPSSGEAPLLLKIKVPDIGEKHELKQVMPYCQKHLNRLSLIRLLNIIPIIITLWIAIYFFIALGGFSGPGGIAIIIQGFFLASIVGMLTQAFVQGVIIKSFQTGTSGTGVSVHTIMQTEKKNVRKTLLVIFGFQNERFATQFEQLNPPDVHIPDVNAPNRDTDPRWDQERTPVYESIKKEAEPLPEIFQTQETGLSDQQLVSDGRHSASGHLKTEPDSIDEIIRQRRMAMEKKNKELFQKKYEPVQTDQPPLQDKPKSPKGPI